MKKLLNKLIIIEFEDKKSEKGILIDYNKDWLLIKANPVDFVLDGYSIVKNFKVKNIVTNNETKFAEKAIKLKGIKIEKKAKIPLQNFDKIIENINKNFGIFSLTKKNNDAIYPGKLKKINHDKIVITWIDLHATWTNKREFKKDKIRVIEFNNDYLTSLKLVADSKLIATTNTLLTKSEFN